MFYVVPRLLHDMIIGRDCLAKYNAKIDYGRDIVQMEISEGLYSMNSVTIAPMTSQLVMVKMRDKQNDVSTGIVARPNRKHTMGPLVAGEQKVKVRKGMAQILCHNKGLKPLHIPGGARIAVAEIAATTERVPASLSDNVNSDAESYRQYRRTDAEYEEALNRLKFEGSVLTEPQKAVIRNVIWGEHDVLSVKEDIGNLRNYEHKIVLKENKPFSCAPYRLSPDARKVLRRELEHHLQQDVITPYMSEFNSPCLLVRKPGYANMEILSANCRLVVDLRNLNQRVVKTKYCLPHIAETISQLDRKSLRYMTLLDLTKGFSQISIEKSSYKYVTFRTDGLGSYCLKRLPMGYVNASEVFQKCMENIIPIELKQHVTVYVDDLLITTSTFEEHARILGKLLNVFSRNGLTVQIDKSKICQRELDFLGYALMPEGVKIKRDNMSTITKMPRPMTVRRVFWDPCRIIGDSSRVLRH